MSPIRICGEILHSFGGGFLISCKRNAEGVVLRKAVITVGIALQRTWEASSPSMTSRTQ